MLETMFRCSSLLEVLLSISRCFVKSVESDIFGEETVSHAIVRPASIEIFAGEWFSNVPMGIIVFQAEVKVLSLLVDLNCSTTSGGTSEGSNWNDTKYN